MNNRFLADQFANLFTRVTGKKILRNLPKQLQVRRNELGLASLETVQTVEKLAEEATRHMDRLDFQTGFIAISEIVQQGNALLSQREFWKMAKSKDEKVLRELEQMIVIVCETVRIASILLLPYTP